MKSKVAVGRRLMSVKVDWTAKDQYVEGGEACESKVIVVSIKCLCFLSTKPFCWEFRDKKSDVESHWKTEKTQRLRSKLTTPIWSENLNGGRKLCFNHSMKHDKFRVNLWFICEQVHPCKTSEMINKDNIIFVAIYWIKRCRTHRSVCTSSKGEIATNLELGNGSLCILP